MSFLLADFEPYRGMTGIYAFWQGDDCTYVGKALCIYQRVKSHRTRFARYGYFTVYDCTSYIASLDYKNAERFLRLMEAYFIMQYDPFENIDRPNFFSLLRKSAKTRIAHDKVAEVTDCYKRIDIPWVLSKAMGNT